MTGNTTQVLRRQYPTFNKQGISNYLQPTSASQRRHKATENYIFTTHQDSISANGTH